MPANRPLVLSQQDAKRSVDAAERPRRRCSAKCPPSAASICRTSRTAFVDFEREPLMPRLLSTEGPALATADVDGDGLDDLFLGGSVRQAGPAARAASRRHLPAQRAARARRRQHRRGRGRRLLRREWRPVARPLRRQRRQSVRDPGGAHARPSLRQRRSRTLHARRRRDPGALRERRMRRGGRLRRRRPRRSVPRQPVRAESLRCPAEEPPAAQRRARAVHRRHARSVRRGCPTRG